MIQHCICLSNAYVRYRRGLPQLEVLRCSRCDTERLAYDQASEAGVLALYTSGEYHQSTTRHDNVVKYAERFEHDKHIGELRIARYTEVLGSLDGKKLLDVGAGNGGFVAAAARHCNARGIDPDPQRALVDRGTIGDVAGFYDIVTYHDVLEHVYNPSAEIQRAVAVLGARGFLIVDVPDVYVASGQHHYKHEHIWYFSLRGLIDLMWCVNLEIIGVDYPIAGKMVVYGQKGRR